MTDRKVSSTKIGHALGLSAATIQRYARDNLIPFDRTRGGHYRFNLIEVQDALPHAASSREPSAPSSGPWKALAVEAAAATGKTFYIGVRGHNRSWFASCDGIEWDASSPEGATRAVHASVIEELKRRVSVAEADAERAKKALSALAHSKDS